MIVRDITYYCDGDSCPRNGEPWDGMLGELPSSTTTEPSRRYNTWLFTKDGKHYCPHCRKAVEKKMRRLR